MREIVPDFMLSSCSSLLSAFCLFLTFNGLLIWGLGGEGEEAGSRRRWI